MAPVYDFRHVELDKIGRGKRIVKPPGGECSDIFGVQDETPNGNHFYTPRKNRYMQSTIFSPTDEMMSPTNGHSTPTTPSPNKKPEDTQDRLFGFSDEDTPRKIVDRQRSNIFEDEIDSGYQTPNKSTPGRNPITGSPIENGTPKTNGHVNDNGIGPGRNPITGSPIENGSPKTNGHVNNSGITNGHYFPESPTNGYPRNRVPPGGHSSGIF